MSDKHLRDELTELTEAVRELRDREVADTLRDLRAEVEKLRAERGTHHCSCTHIHWQPHAWAIPGTATYPNCMVTSGASYVTTNAAAGWNPAVTTLSISN